MSQNGIDGLVAQLDLSTALQRVCWPCLSFVATPLGEGDERSAKREARKVAPNLWEEGLAAPATAALSAAKRRGLPGAGEALASVTTVGGRSPVAIAIVLRLAAELDEWSKKSLAARFN